MSFGTRGGQGIRVGSVVGSARQLSRRLLHRVRSERSPRSQVYSIGIFGGPSLTALAPLDGVENPVLTREHVSDVHASFVADPFMIEADGRWYMFFEVLNGPASRGEIGLATSTDALTWRYEQIVLREPFHLSYPYVFSHEGRHYMVPEMCTQEEIWLYHATDFPVRWERLCLLLSGRDWVDASLVFVDGTWWLYCSEGTPPNRAETLRLFHSDRLEGSWREHPSSPVIAGDACLSRPAGRLVVSDGSVTRFAQDCAESYGLAVRAVVVDTLTKDAYRERVLESPMVLHGSGGGWNAGGMHHLDPHRRENGRWLACVDGWRWSD